MIGICTDSSSQLPAELAERYCIEVVPLTIEVDNVEYLEGVDLDVDTFYAEFSSDHRPAVVAMQPSPGQFVAAYEDLLARGCTEILSIHSKAAASGIINAARLAAHALPAPVRLIDSSSAGFGISCCVWAAAVGVANGATLEQAAQIAEQSVPTIGNVFVLDAFDDTSGPGGSGLAVLTLRDGAVEVVGRVASAIDAVNAMAAYAIAWGQRVRVGVGHSDVQTAVLADALEAAVAEAANVADVVRYRVGPSLGTQTGPGTAGCFVFPA